MLVAVQARVAEIEIMALHEKLDRSMSIISRRY